MIERVSTDGGVSLAVDSPLRDPDQSCGTYQIVCQFATPFDVPAGRIVASRPIEEAIKCLVFNWRTRLGASHNYTPFLAIVCPGKTLNSYVKRTAYFGRSYIVRLIGAVILLLFLLFPYWT